MPDKQYLWSQSDWEPRSLYGSLQDQPQVGAAEPPELLPSQAALISKQKQVASGTDNIFNGLGDVLFIAFPGPPSSETLVWVLVKFEMTLFHGTDWNGQGQLMPLEACDPVAYFSWVGGAGRLLTVRAQNKAIANRGSAGSSRGYQAVNLASLPAFWPHRIVGTDIRISPLIAMTLETPIGWERPSDPRGGGSSFSVSVVKSSPPSQPPTSQAAATQARVEALMLGFSQELLNSPEWWMYWANQVRPGQAYPTSSMEVTA